MKKFLSLVLALIMTMSLVTIGAGAKEFTDDDKIAYEEAVNVISTIGVVDGYEDGSFNPQGALTRGAAAKIICNMILGPTTAAELRADTAPFKDVPTNQTFAGYIAYCAKEGIISGYADGTFRPSGTLTGYAFMKMLLGALGYDATREGYTGANWSINVAKQALAIGLNDSLDGDFNGVKAVNREEACLYAFNTLKADLVEYETIVSTTINGEAVNIGSSIAKAQQWNNSATRIDHIEKDGFIQFAEQYFPKLELSADIDAFGRPTREWEFNGKDIGTYVNTDLLVETYTKKVTGKDLYELLGKSTVDEYSFDIYVDGETSKDILDSDYFNVGNLVKTNTEKVGGTGNGVTTEVYVDTDAKEVTIAIINTYLAQATDDYNEKKEEVSFKVFKIDEVADGHFVKTKKETEVLKVSNDDINVEDVEEDDIVLVTVADGEIQTIAQPDVLEEVTITKFSKESSVTTGGSDYKYADTAMYDVEVLDAYDDQNLKETSYNVYLDANGYLVGVDIVEEASKYAFLTGIEGGYSNLSNKNVDANVIFLDGTMETIKVNTSKSSASLLGANGHALRNTWCIYSVDKNGIYTLTEVKSTTFDDSKDKVGQSVRQDEAGTPTVIDKKHVTLPGAGSFSQVYGNDASVYITVDTKVIHSDDPNDQVIIIDDVDSVSTGVQSTSIQPYSADMTQEKHLDADGDPIVTNDKYTSHGVYTLFKNNGYVIGAVVVGEDEGNTTNYVFVISDEPEVESYDDIEEEYTWNREVIIDGKVEMLTEVGENLTEIGEDDMEQGKWYEVKFFADGTVRRATEMSFDNATGYHSFKWVDDISKVEGTVENNDTVVLYTDLTDGTYAVSTKSNTLQISNIGGYAPYGFGVRSDAKVVLVQDKQIKGEDKVSEMKYVEEYENGVKGLDKIISYLNANDGFLGYIGAIFDNGVASSIVIWDRTATIVDTGNQGIVLSSKNIWVNLSDPTSVQVVYKTGSKPTKAQAVSLIAQALIDAGYDIEETYIDGSGNYCFDVTEKIGGFPVKSTYKWNPNTAVTEGNQAISVNGASILVDEGETLENIIDALDLEEPQGGYARLTNKKGEVSYVELEEDTTIDEDTVAVAFDYVKVTIGDDETYVKYGASATISKPKDAKGTYTAVTVGEGEAEYVKYGSKVTANGDVSVEGDYVKVSVKVTQSTALKALKPTIKATIDEEYVEYNEEDAEMTIAVTVEFPEELEETPTITCTVGDGEAAEIEDNSVTATVKPTKDTAITIALDVTAAATENP